MFRVVSPRVLAIGVPLSAALLVSLAGCARDPAQRHADEMRESILKREGDQDRLVTAEDPDAPRGRAPSGAKTDAGAKPPLTKTIQLGGADSDGEDDDPNAPNARPKIELSGSPSSYGTRPRPRSNGAREGAPSGRRETRIEMLGPPPEGGDEQPAPPAPPAPDKTTDAAKGDPNKPDAPSGGAPKKGPAPRDRARPTDPKAPKETR